MSRRRRTLEEQASPTTAPEPTPTYVVEVQVTTHVALRFHTDE